MGLFDRFGVGGGKLEIHPSAVQLAQGGHLGGTISFTSGSRAQQITHIKAKLTQTMVQTVQGAKGPEQRHQTNVVCPEATLAGQFTTEPGKRYDFPIDFQLPAQLPGSVHGQVSYRLSVSADIDNEIDPGAGVDLQITGGPMMGVQQGTHAQPQVFGGVIAAVGAMHGVSQAMGAPMQPPMQTPMAPPMPMGPPPVGTPVIAQWQDGQWYPGRVVQHHGEMIGVDWDNPQLGQSTWLQLHQVRAQAPAMPMAPPAMPQPHYGAQAFAPTQPVQHKPQVAAQRGGLGVGSLVFAQHPSGGVHAGKILQVSGEQYAIDWEDAKLGASSWVKAGNLKPR